MNRDLRVLVLTHHGRGLGADGAVAEGGAFIVHRNDADVFSHDLKGRVEWKGTNVPVCGAKYSQTGTKLP